MRKYTTHTYTHKHTHTHLGVELVPEVPFPVLSVEYPRDLLELRETLVLEKGLEGDSLVRPLVGRRLRPVEQQLHVQYNRPKTTKVGEVRVSLTALGRGHRTVVVSD